VRRNSIQYSKLRHKAKQLIALFNEVRGKTILVEGKRDKKALENCGVDARIVLINRSPDSVSESLSGLEEAVLLTDFDDYGEELCGRMAESLQAFNVKPNTAYRKKLRYLLGVRCFEELDTRLDEFTEKLVENKVI